MAEITPAIAARIDSNCAAMATLAYQHCVEVYPVETAAGVAGIAG